MSKKQKLKDEFFTSVKLEVISYLSCISNQNVTVPIPNHYKEEITVKNLIDEVEKGTEIGIVYMGEYVKNLSLSAGLKIKTADTKKSTFRSRIKKMAQEIREKINSNPSLLIQH